MSTPPSASVAVPQPQRASSAGRMPSLNQLAARININNGNPAVASGTTSSTSNRPRLAASLLRTGAGSSTSVSTVASTADSLVVNAPSTRSGSPATVGTASPPPQSQTPTIPEDTTPDALTSEKLERLNQETMQAPERKTKVGYKNIPSLDAITQRLAKARSLSIDGSSKPPEAQMIQDPQTPGVSMKAPEHPLQYPW